MGVVGRNLSGSTIRDESKLRTAFAEQKFTKQVWKAVLSEKPQVYGLENDDTLNEMIAKAAAVLVRDRKGVRQLLVALDEVSIEHTVK